MDYRRPLVVMLLAAGPAFAQQAAAPAPAPAKPQPPAAAPAPTTAPPATTASGAAPAAADQLQPAPMPDPLMSPDLQHLPGGGPPSLARYAQQAAWQDAVIAAAHAQYKLMPDACGAAALKPSGKLTLFAPPKFDASGVLVQAIWSESVKVTNCATEPHILNVLTLLEPGNPPSRIPIMPGDSHADPATQKNALQYAQAVAMRGGPTGCKQEMFTDTAFDGYTGLPNPEVKDGRDSRAWRENWNLWACGANYTITMTFTPNANGTQLQATNPIKR